MSKTWKIPVAWEMCALLSISANTLEEAVTIAKEDESIPLPPTTESSYVDGSWEVSIDDVEYIRQCYNKNHPDANLEKG